MGKYLKRHLIVHEIYIYAHTCNNRMDLILTKSTGTEWLHMSQCLASYLCKYIFFKSYYLDLEPTKPWVHIPSKLEQLKFIMLYFYSQELHPTVYVGCNYLSLPLTPVSHNTPEIILLEGLFLRMKLKSFFYCYRYKYYQIFISRSSHHVTILLYTPTV